MLNEKICAHCGNPMPNATDRQKYCSDCAQIVRKQQMREWYYAKKIQDPKPNQIATPRTVAVALGYNLDTIDGWALLACTLIADGANEYIDLYTGKSNVRGELRDKEMAEIEEFFASYGMPTLCKKIKQMSK